MAAFDPDKHLVDVEHLSPDADEDFDGGYDVREEEPQPAYERFSMPAPEEPAPPPPVAPPTAAPLPSAANGASSDPVIAPADLERLIGPRWTEQDRNLLEKALQSARPQYREDVLAAVMNLGYPVTDEMFMFIALFGLMTSTGKDLGAVISDEARKLDQSLDSRVAEITDLHERFENTVSSQRKEQESILATFPTTMQKTISAVMQTIQEQASEFAENVVRASISREEQSMRISIQQIVKDETKVAFKVLVTQLEGMFEKEKRGARVPLLGWLDTKGRPVVVKFPSGTGAILIYISLTCLGTWLFARWVLLGSVHH